MPNFAGNNANVGQQGNKIFLFAIFGEQGKHPVFNGNRYL